MGEAVPIYYSIVAFFCTGGAIALAVLHIYKHLLNYTEPTYQRFIVRIIFMVPVYALMSFLCLVLPDSSIYFNSVREVYEAWVIYNFLTLCLEWVGGPGAVVISLSGRILKPSWYLMTCCLPPIPLDGRFIRKCKQGCLQFPFNPVPKFIIIKSVVFLTYWQGVLFFLAAKSGFIENADEAAQLQNFIICVEMLVAAVGHFYAFPYKEYAGANIGQSRGLTASIAHALMINDFYHDTVHQFAPTYHDYVLYNHGEGEEGTRKYRSRTFVPMGPEMDTVRRNKHMFGNKTEDVQLSNLSSPNTSVSSHSGRVSETMNSSLLVDISNSTSTPYDMTLIDLDESSYPAKVSAAGKAGISSESDLVWLAAAEYIWFDLMHYLMPCLGEKKNKDDDRVGPKKITLKYDYKRRRSVKKRSGVQSPRRLTALSANKAKQRKFRHRFPTICVVRRHDFDTEP
ncbi:hypothetical protein K1719_035472 [Acacia pycnantha]|nr:hypothetical protein K1719_035472 [Acacia pycnantha]